MHVRLSSLFYFVLYNLCRWRFWRRYPVAGYSSPPFLVPLIVGPGLSILQAASRTRLLWCVPGIKQLFVLTSGKVQHVSHAFRCLETRLETDLGAEIIAHTPALRGPNDTPLISFSAGVDDVDVKRSLPVI